MTTQRYVVKHDRFFGIWDVWDSLQREPLCWFESSASAQSVSDSVNTLQAKADRAEALEKRLGVAVKMLGVLSAAMEFNSGEVKAFLAAKEAT
jgi:hypothetical protein